MIQASSEFVEILPSAHVAIDLRYGSTDNFVGRNLYGEHAKAYLHRIAAEKLEKAAKNLASIQPRYKLLVLDALRPGSVQQILWDQVKGTDQQNYVADPKKGSIHSYGFAVDLTIIDERGSELDMGTPFDDFTELSQVRPEPQFFRDGLLSQKHLENRQLLRKVMEDAGFIQLPIEWWHYDALPRDQVVGHFPLVG